MYAILTVAKYKYNLNFAYLIIYLFIYLVIDDATS